MAEIAQLLTQAPLPELIRQLGRSVADAQAALDRVSIDVALMMTDPARGVTLSDGGETLSLLELGFTPTFYQIQQASLEAKVAFSVARSSESSLSVGGAVGGAAYFVMFAATVNATYAARYSFEASGSSAINVSIAAVPPPSILTTRLAERQRQALNQDEEG